LRVRDRVPRRSDRHLAADDCRRPPKRRDEHPRAENDNELGVLGHVRSPQRAMYFLKSSICLLSSGRSLPAMTTRWITDRISSGSPFTTTRFATLPVSMLPTALSTPRIFAASSVNALIASSCPRPHATARPA